MKAPRSDRPSPLGLFLVALLWLGFCPVVVAGRVDLELAQQALQDGKPQEALKALGPADTTEAFEELSDREQRLVVARENLRGRALFELDRLEEARLAYDRILAWAPTDRAATEGLIQVLFELEDWTRLRQVAGRRALEPDSRPELLLLAAEASRQLEDRLLTLHYARLGVARFPEERRFRVRLAQALTDLGEAQAAAEAGLYLVKLEPTEVAWWRALARARRELGDEPGARHALEVGLAIEPENLDLLRDHLVSLVNADHASAARRLAKRLVGTGPPQPDLIKIAVHAAWIAEDYPLAREWLDKLTEAERDAEWYRLSLELDLLRKEPQRALKAAQALIERGEADGRVRLQAARLSEQVGDPISAKAHLRVALEDSNSEWVHRARLSLARLLLDSREVGEAEILVRAALGNRPGDTTAHYLLKAIQAEAQPDP